MSGGRQHATQKRARARLSAAIGWLVLTVAAAAADVTPADLQAAVRSLGFLSSLQNRPSILIGVAYNGIDPASKAMAFHAAAELARLAGPGSATVSAVPVAVQELTTQRFDALYLMPLPTEVSRPVAEFVRRQGIVSVSADPACLETQICVLLVQSRTTISVVLDTALANAVGAKFSTVFTMLVKRK